MQYSVELWTNYNKVYHLFNAHIKGLNDLIEMFSERYKSKKNLAETLKKLSESKNPITSFESLTEGIEDEVDFDQYKDKMVIASNRDFPNTVSCIEHVGNSTSVTTTIGFRNTIGVKF